MMKVLFIGLGSISTKHIKDIISIASMQNIECEITVLRRSIGELSEDLRSYNIKQITEFGSIAYDVVFITNPTNMHYQILEQIKGKTKFYFIEKPIFENSNYDWKSLGINEKNAYIACPMRHSAVYKKLKEIVDANKIFSARIICSSYLPEWRPTIDYRKNYSAIKKLGGGVSLDLIHEIDYMVDLFGMPKKIINIHGQYSDLEIDSDDLSVYIAQYNDKLCEVHLDYFGRKYQRTCELYSQNGAYIADFNECVIKLPNGNVLDCKENKSNIYSEMEWFVNFIQGKNKINLNPPELAFNVLKLSIGEK